MCQCAERSGRDETYLIVAVVTTVAAALIYGRVYPAAGCASGVKYIIEIGTNNDALYDFLDRESV